MITQEIIYKIGKNAYFKPGDKVIAIRTSVCKSYLRGTEYTVEELDRSMLRTTLDSKGVRHNAWHQVNFRKLFR
jgi:hypothetical protein